MNEKTYTLAELKQAQEEVADALGPDWLPRVTTQADKNRNQGYTEDQVRAAVARRAMLDTAVSLARKFADDVIADLKGSPSFVSGGVYRYKDGRSKTLYLCQDSHWETFGNNVRLADHMLETGNLERVL